MKYFSSLITALTLLTITISCTDKNMSKNTDGSYTINTIELGKKIKGYNAQVPISIIIKDTVIQQVALYENDETPDYLIDVENRLLPKYKNLSINNISNVDAVSGATFTSRAVMRNVDVAVKYYLENK